MTSLILAAVLLGDANPVLKGLDPIDLSNGLEISGFPQFTARLGRHIYRFSSLENLNKFSSDPYRYGVMNGGACGKMGPMSGHGSPDRWSVVDGRIYLFASEGCRTTFLNNLADYQPRQLKTIATTAREVKDGQGVFDQAIAAHGGKKAVSAIRTAEWDLTIPYKEGGKDKIWHTKGGWYGRDQLAIWQEWDAGISFFFRDRQVSREGKPGAVFVTHPSERRELTKEVLRHPAAILLDGRESVVKSAGKNAFLISKEGIQLHVRLDAKTNLIEGVGFEDLYQGRYSKVEVNFSGYRNFKGIQFPMSFQTTVNGTTGKVQTYASLKLNAAKPKFFSER